MYGLGDLNCPGDPGCPGYVAPDSSAYQTSLLQEILANQSSAVAPGVVSSAPAAGSLTAWLNANSTLLLAGAGAVVVLALFTGGRRR